MTKYADSDLFQKDMTAAAYVAGAFALYAIVLAIVIPPTDANWLHADPILKIISKSVTVWGIPVLSAAVLIAWLMIRPMMWRDVFASFKHVLSGAALAVAAALALRLVFGPSLPEFIPPEESAKPGYLLGMAAGLSEELIFRLILTPLLFIALRKRMGFYGATISAVALAALAFALLHEVGPAAAEFSAHHFIARVLVPGIAMGLLVFAVSPPFVVAMHCTAHVMIPLLFV